VSRTVQFARGETDEGLDVAAPVVVEGVLWVIRHPARGQFPAVVELQVREALRKIIRLTGRPGLVNRMIFLSGIRCLDSFL
jgi:hypothetical protein